MRSDGREIVRSSFVADRRGIIPTVAIWWEPGVEYAKSRWGRLNLETFFRYTYACRVLQKQKAVLEIPIRFRPLKETGPIIYSSTENGDSLNGFIRGRENVFVTGLNFPPDSRPRIHLVRDRYFWETGGRIDPQIEKPLILQLEKRRTGFTALLWPKERTRTGSYDIIVEYETPNGVFDRVDIVDSAYSVGFTVFDLESQGNHIETDLACQAPSQDPATGTVIGAPSPIYKDVFSPAEEVWVAVNPYTGGGNYVGQTARLYVVNHLVEADWIDGKPLTDVSSDSYQVATIQPGCANVNYTKVWSGPTIREDGYDVIVDFPPFGVYNKGQDIIDKLEAKGFYVPTLWVCLESVALNHDSASASADALNIRKNWNEDVTVPEWQKAKKSHPAAYVRNKNVTVKAVFSSAPGVINARIRAGVGYGPLDSLVQKMVNFAGGSSGAVYFNISVATPNAVNAAYQKWRWYCADVNGSGSAEVQIADSTNLIYIVLVQPQAPWTTSGQAMVWTDVLQRSCLWAFGETTVAGAAGKIAQHIFNDIGGLYVYGSQYTGPTIQDFNLTGFLANVPSIGTVNCYDMGKSLVIFADSIGAGLVYAYSSPFGSLYCEHAIGRPWKCNEGFSNHGFGYLSGNVFDACLTVDTDSDPASGPPYLETWMLNEIWASYKAKVVKSGTPGNPAAHSFGIY
jgi:hypothetical protein